MKQQHWWLAVSLPAILSVTWLCAATGVWAGAPAKPLPGAFKDNEDDAQAPVEGRSRMPCAEIMRIVTRHRLRPADPSGIGRSLHQEPAWVERCMVAYGRTIRRPAASNLELKEEGWESSEPAETGQEEGGDAYQFLPGEKAPHPEREPAGRRHPSD